jgi:hypothetical protein
MAEVSGEWRAALEQVLEPGDATGQVLEFVLTGEPARALHDARGGPGWQHSFGWLNKPQQRMMATLYGGFAEVDAVVLRRWGKVLDASPRSGTGLGGLGDRHWPELMLQQAAAVVPSGPLPLTFADLERIAAVDGLAAADLVRMAFTIPEYARYERFTAQAHGYLARVPGFAEAVAAHRDVVASALASGPVDQRVAGVSLLSVLDDTVVAACAGELAEAATGTSVKVGEPAREVLSRVGAAAVEPLRSLASGGAPGRRAQALDLLAAFPDQREWARATAAADQAASVRAVIARWDAAEAPAEAEELVPELVPLPSWALPADEAERVASQVYECVRRGVAVGNRALEELARRDPAHYPRGPRLATEPPSSLAADLARLLADDRPVSVGTELSSVASLSYLVHDQLAELIRTRVYPPATAIQLMLVFRWFGQRGGYGRWEEVLDELHARTGIDLLTIQRMLNAAGVDGRAFLWLSYSRVSGARLGRDWPDEDVWPFFASNLDWLLENWSTFQGWTVDEHALFAALATFPRPPARVADRLYAQAVGPGKSDRLPAQLALARDPRRTVRVAAALQDGRAEVRHAAAQWLTRIADPAARPALRDAWDTEKQDVVRGALLDALTAIGEDAAAYLDPATTAAGADKFVAKGLPAALSWVDWGTVPGLTWVATGEPVPLTVVQWLCGTAVKAKSPEPDAVLRHYASMFDVAGRERLAAHLLGAWIAEDVRPIPAAEAEARAAQEAVQYHRWYSTQPGRFFGMTVQQIEAALLPGLLKTPAGSATASKGLLAVVAACGGADVAQPTGQYLRLWFGYRSTQGKALLGMLSWIEDPGAIQVLLSIGTRFRTKNLQDEAIRLAGELAERKRWTVDELADRTIPTAGFGDDGALELSYGSRVFTAILGPDLTVSLRDPDGKVIKALPAPRQSDDAEMASDSRKTIAAVRREIKDIAAQQAQRLYEGMCTGRTWVFGDWRRYLLRHPVAGLAVRRLVWAASSGGDGEPVVFRPLDDGTLTDADDNPVTLPDDAVVRIAHDSVLAADQVKRWAHHLADYEVSPLFQQLGRGVHPIAPQARSGRELSDFHGHVLEAFALRGRAAKLGYTRGGAEDNGWFETYHKRFPALGLVATITFTGNGIPEENRLVALRHLAFHKAANTGPTPLPLADVPQILLSECWHDLLLIAAEGPGYDPDWEKKTK